MDAKNGDVISRQEVDKKLVGLYNMCWEYDIPSPTVPEYVEFHEAITAIMKAIKEIRREIDELPSAQPEITYCKDCVKHNRRFAEYPADEACPLTVWRTAQGHEFDYQYCVYGRRKKDDK